MNWKSLLATAAIGTCSANAAMIVEWKQDELFGALMDSTGNHPEGIPIGSPTFGAPGVPNGTYGAISISEATGSAIDYGPSTDDEYFEIGFDNDNPVMNLDTTGNFTVMGWMNPLAPTVVRSYKILSTGSIAGADRGWGFALRLNNTAGTGSSVRFTTFGIADNDSMLFDVTFGAWIHLAATYSNGLITYYLNGNVLDSDFSAFGNEGLAGRLVVGSRAGGNDADQMNGMLDGIRVYDEVLTEAQIREAAVGSVSVVPEPSAAALGLIAGLVWMGSRRRR